MIAHILDQDESLWAQFAQRHALSAFQIDQFKKYYELLVRTNDIHNLTTITDVSHVITDHFDDSLALAKFIDLKSISNVADVGTGAGFPAIPLKICFPHLSLVLIEVSQKRIYFLEMLIEQLNLSDVIIAELDWRTFLRKTSYQIDIFCARASLQPEELMRMFMPSSPYRDAQLVYWASEHWVSDAKISEFIQRSENYQLQHKKRKLIFFKAQF